MSKKEYSDTTETMDSDWMNWSTLSEEERRVLNEKSEKIADHVVEQMLKNLHNHKNHADND